MIKQYKAMTFSHSIVFDLYNGQTGKMEPLQGQENINFSYSSIDEEIQVETYLDKELSQNDSDMVEGVPPKHLETGSTTTDKGK